MRHPREFDTVDGKRYRVRFRDAGMETSETFRRKADATTFATILDGGGVRAANEWLDARKQGQRNDDELTFGQWYAAFTEELTGVTDRTRNSYAALHANHFAHLDRLPLQSVTKGHVAAIVNGLEQSGRAPKTVQNVVYLLSTICASAVDEGHLVRNPCRKVKITKAALTDTDPRFLTHDEFRALYAATPEHYRPLVAFLVGTGMRWSEATAVQCRHVNLEAGTVLVRQAWKEQGGRELGPPKTVKGRRTVNAAATALVAVAPLIRKPDDWLFTTATGRIVRHSNFYNRPWKEACEASGVKATPHDLRHTHASWLISDGQSLEAVQDQLGHESILTTRKIYGHLLPAIGVEVGRSASRALDRALLDGVHAEIQGRVGVIEPAGRPDQGTHANHE